MYIETKNLEKKNIQKEMYKPQELKRFRVWEYESLPLLNQDGNARVAATTKYFSLCCYFFVALFAFSIFRKAYLLWLCFQ